MQCKYGARMAGRWRSLQCVVLASFDFCEEGAALTFRKLFWRRLEVELSEVGGSSGVVAANISREALTVREVLARGVKRSFATFIAGGGGGQFAGVLGIQK